MLMIENLVSLLTPLEMLLVNLFIIDRCFKRKYSALFTYSILVLFGLVVVAFTFFVVTQLPFFGSGNGFFVFGGFLYLFPLRFLYQTTISKIVTSACTAWIYTFIVFSISVHTSDLIPQFSKPIVAFAIQTTLYALTLYWIYRIMKNYFIEMIDKLSQKETTELMWLSMIWFWAVFILNSALIYNDNVAIQMFTIITIATCAFVSFRFIYRIIFKDREIRSLEKLAYYDDLTQVRGRLLLTQDSKELIDNKKEFSLIFLDLDRFKEINDRYGHSVGDDYLVFFAQEVEKRLANKGMLYRSSGDEFICIHKEGDESEFLASLESIPQTLPDSDVAFYGASMGVAHYPADGATIDQLIHVADQRMYSMKKQVYVVHDRRSQRQTQSSLIME